MTCDARTNQHKVRTRCCQLLDVAASLDTAFGNDRNA